jgi:RNA polymerase sigma factor (sigma-70 family)
LNLDSIYREYKNQVFNLALSYLANREDAEEVTQDVFISIYQTVEQFRGESKLSTWIYRITVNKSLDKIRSRKRKKRWATLLSFTGEKGENFDYAVHFDHPGVKMEEKECLVKLYGMIDSLPDNQRTAIILTKFEDRPQEEAAQIMGITRKAVESLVQRAKKNLMEKLEGARD